MSYKLFSPTPRNLSSLLSGPFLAEGGMRLDFADKERVPSPRMYFWLVQPIGYFYAGLTEKKRKEEEAR